jgi:hypothetical protein
MEKFYSPKYFIIYPNAMANVHNVSQVYDNRRVYLHYALSFGSNNTFLGLTQSACFRQYSSPGVERNLSLFPQGKPAGADNSDNCLKIQNLTSPQNKERLKVKINYIYIYKITLNISYSVSPPSLSRSLPLSHSK